MVSVTDQMLENNEAYSAAFRKGGVSNAPETRVAVVACMDARLNVYALLGLREGDAHVIRNAGGVVTEDVIRSLAISQRLVGTREIIVLKHTDCRMLTFLDDDFKEQVRREAGIRPPFAFGAFSNLEDAVRQSIARIHASPFVPNKDQLRGFVYDVASGRLREVL